MSRQDAARAALRSLTNHVEQEEPQLSLTQHATPPMSSYFGGGALQITDSPSSSPNLAAFHFHQDDALPRSARRLADGSVGTPGTSDVPSLSLSSSSFSDGPLRSPFTEHAPSQKSISSTRTVQQHHFQSHHRHPDDAAMDEDERTETGTVTETTLRRVASNLRMSVDDVRRVERYMAREAHEPNLGAVDSDELMEDLGRERLCKVMEAVHAEEDRLAQINSFRSAYVSAEAQRADLELHHHKQRQQAQRRHVAILHSIPLSPPPAYDQLDFLDRNAPIPSPRAALESLTASSSSNGSSQHQASFFEQASRAQAPHRNGYWNTSSSPYHTHAQQASSSSSGPRPVSLPDRSYRSMDDYTAQAPTPSPLLRNSAKFPVRKSMYGTLSSSPSQRQTMSRPASRSPMIGSPRILGSEEGSEPHSQHHLRPMLASSRQRSPSNNGYDGRGAPTMASRRASAEVLGQSIQRTSSPLGMDNNGGPLSQLPVSHEEVMARLQRKVKERLAAKNSGQDYSSANVIVGGRAKAPASGSPLLSKHSSLPYGSPPASIGRSGRRRQGSVADSQRPSAARRSGSNNGRNPRKSASLKTLSGKMDQCLDDDANMQDVVEPCDNGTAGMGIEALLSAAAIADSPRKG